MDQTNNPKISGLENLDFLALVESKTQKFLGVKIEELNKDLSSKLTNKPFFNFNVDISLPFKKAKANFKKDYLKRLLELNYGNISLVAKKIDVDRRTLHRLLRDSNINVEKIRQEMLRPIYFKQEEVSTIINDVLARYKDVIHPKKFNELYSNVNEISRDISNQLPDETMTFKEAEEEFEKRYLEEALLKYNFNVAITAKQIKIRVETIFRKMKRLGIFRK